MMPTTDSSRVLADTGSVLKVFFALFFSLSFLLGVVSYVVHRSETGSRIRIIKDREVQNVNAYDRSFTHISESIVSDLMILSSLSDLNLLINTGSEEHRKTLGLEFLAISRFKGYYDQIRFLDDTGMEVVRVNYNNGKPSIVPDDKLQLKAHRYYFKNTFSRGSEQIYISPFDLNIENGQIERPFKPIIRLGMPVFNNRGEKKGIVILNFLGKEFIYEVEHEFYGSSGQAMLLNSDGYWLKGPVVEDEWGFMFEDKLDMTFAKRFPEAWDRVSKEDFGQFISPEGLFTFTTIYPISEGLRPNVDSSETSSHIKESVGSSGYYWKFVSFVPQELISTGVLDFIKSFNIIHGIILFFIGGSSWFMAQARANSKRAEAETRESEVKFHSIFESSNDAIMLLDTAGFLDCNEATLKMFGCSSRDDFLGRHPGEWSPATQSDGRGSRAVADEMVATALREGRNFFEWTHRRANGEDFSAEVLLTPMRLEGREALQATVRDISERKRAEERIEYLAHYDPLTGLPNRFLLLDRLGRSLVTAHREKQRLSVLFLDLNGFKTINDTHGHEAGDAILKEVAHRLMETVREADTVGRVGGDEFVIVLSNVKSTKGAETVAGKVHVAMEVPFMVAGHGHNVGASIGISMYPEDATDSDTLISQADSAMYIAKKKEGNTYHFYADGV